MHLMQVTPASGRCLPCLSFPVSLHSKNPFTLQKVFLGLPKKHFWGLPQAEELPTCIHFAPGRISAVDFAPRG